MTYTDGNLSAAIAYRGSDYRTFIMGFPLKVSKKKRQKHHHGSVLQFLTTN